MNGIVFERRASMAAGSRADSILIVWLPDEAVTAGFFATLTSLSQGLVCREDSATSVCSTVRNLSRTPGSDPTASRLFQDRRSAQLIGLSGASR